MHPLKLTVILMVAFVFSMPSVRAEPLKLRVAWIQVPTSLAPILFEPPGVATHLGISYTLEPIHFAGSSPMITALAANELDIATMGYSAFGLAVQNARLDDLRFIADEDQDGVEDYYVSAFMVLKDGPIRTVEDLKGKVLATNVIGATLDLSMRAMLRRHGLEDKRDYSVVEIEYPNMKTALASHRADLISTSTTFAQDPELKAMTRDLFTVKDAMGVTQVLAWVARSGFIAEHRAQLVDFMEDVLRSRRWYSDPAHHAEAVQIVANFTKQPAARFDSWVFTRKDIYRGVEDKPNLEAIQSNLQDLKAMGLLNIDIDVKQHADLSLVEEAAKRLQ